MTDPTLKCVIASSPRRNLCTLVEDVLRAHVPLGELVAISEDAYIANTEATTAQVRDWLHGALEEDETALVVEFEKWSGCGPVDSAWLMRRGH